MISAEGGWRAALWEGRGAAAEGVRSETLGGELAWGARVVMVRRARLGAAME